MIPSDGLIKKKGVKAGNYIAAKLRQYPYQSNKSVIFSAKTDIFQHLQAFIPARYSQEAACIQNAFLSGNNHIIIKTNTYECL